MLPVFLAAFFRCFPPFGGDCDSCLPVQCRLVMFLMCALSSCKGEMLPVFAGYKGQTLCVFLLGSFVVFCPLCFQSSTFLSLRFVGVVPSDFFRLRMVYCVDSARFFYGKFHRFRFPNFFWEVCLSYPCSFRSSTCLSPAVQRNFSGANFRIKFRERTLEVCLLYFFRLRNRLLVQCRL